MVLRGTGLLELPGFVLWEETHPETQGGHANRFEVRTLFLCGESADH